MNLKKNKIDSNSKKRFWTILKLPLFIIGLVYIILTFFPYDYTVVKYDHTFGNLSLVKTFGSENLNFINLQLNVVEKNFTLTHQVFGLKLLKTNQNRIKFNIQNLKENILKISQNEQTKEQDFFFQLKKIDTYRNDINCYNVTIDHKLDSNIDVETCFDLNGYWFGGHESYGQPYWPINSQVFDYVPYVTG